MKTVKVIGLIALIFVAGFAGGAVATRMVVRRMVANAIAHPAGAGAKMEEVLDRKLRLDEAQRQRIHEILKVSREKMRDAREELPRQLNAIAFDARTNISGLLKPEQQKRFEQFILDNRQFLPVREAPEPRK